MSEDHHKSIKRFGARYGRTLKLKFAKIEHEQRKKHKCPYCAKAAVKRISTGIWYCNRCDSKFTGKAYTIAKTQQVTQAVDEKELALNYAEEEKKKQQLQEQEQAELASQEAQ